MGRGATVAATPTKKAWTFAMRMMARSLVMVSFPLMVDRVPHSLRLRGASASGMRPCPFAYAHAHMTTQPNMA